jgi:hypothetical protein
MPNKRSRLLLLNLLGGSASFNPLSIPNLALWLDASDTRTLFQASNGTTPATANNDPVGYWGDKSGLGRNAIQATAGSRPTLITAGLNGRASVYSNSLQFLTASAAIVAQPVTVVMVAKSTSSNGVLFTTGLVDDCLWVSMSTGVNPAYAAPNTRTGSITRNDVAFVVDAVFNNPTSALTVDGQSASTTTPGVQTAKGTWGVFAFTAGDYGADAYISELLVYTAALSAGELSLLRQYLGSKWGVTITP